MTERVDVLVIGAGVIGLAVARALAMDGRDVIVCEQHESFGTETSSRNSEVIHAGIYYRPGGLRAALCRPGKHALYDYARARHVPFRPCGKLVVGHGDADRARLIALQARAVENGVHDLELIDADAARAMEPALTCTHALWSPSSGIIDSHSLMLALLADVEHAGGVLALQSPVIGGRTARRADRLRGGGRVTIEIGGAGAMTLNARLVVNCGGLHADRIARSITGLDARNIPALRPAKGIYFTITGKAPFSRLIYPLHEPDSQGIHYTTDLGGQGRLGPDISWNAPLGDYSVDAARREDFARAARAFWPDASPDRLQPAYAGQRPKATGPGEEGDFLIRGAGEHGTPGYIGLYAMESPGLTACLAIGSHVAAMARADEALSS